MPTSPSRRRLVPFRVEVTAGSDGTRVTPVGELDVATVGKLDERLRELREAGMRRLVLDLDELDFMDSSGLRLLLTLDAEARQDGLELALVGGSGSARRVLEVTGVLDRLPFASA